MKDKRLIYSTDIPKDLGRLDDKTVYDIYLHVVSELRSRHFAVITWTPDELKFADPKLVEDRSIELGHEIIADLQPLGEAQARQA